MPRDIEQLATILASDRVLYSLDLTPARRLEGVRFGAYVAKAIAEFDTANEVRIVAGGHVTAFVYVPRDVSLEALDAKARAFIMEASR